MGFIDQTIDPKYLTLWNQVHVTGVSLVFACLELFSLILSSIWFPFFPTLIPIVLLCCIPPVLTIVGITKTKHACLLPTLIIDALYLLAIVVGSVVSISNILSETTGYVHRRTFYTNDDKGWIVAGILFGSILSLSFVTYIVKIDYLSFKFIKEKERAAARTFETVFV